MHPILEKKQRRLVNLDMVSTALRESLADRKEQSLLQHNADIILLTAIDCMITGRLTEGEAVAAKAVQFYEAAIASNERDKNYRPDGTDAVRYDYCALAHWVWHSLHHQPYYDLAVSYEDRWLVSKARNKADLELALPMYLSAGRHELVLELLEATGADLNRITPLSVGKSESKMAALVSRYQVRHDVSREDLSVATDGFLHHRMDEWLSRYGTFTAARWMKVLLCDTYEGEKPQSHEVLGRCAQYLSSEPADAR